MSLHSKLLFILSVGMIVVILNTVFIFKLYKDREENLKWVNHTHEVILHTESFLSHLKDSETGQRGFLLTKDPIYLQPYHSGVNEAKEYFKKLQESTTDNPDQQKRLHLIKKYMVLKFTELDETIKLTRVNNHSKAIEIVKKDIGKQYMDNMRNILNEFIDVEKFFLKERKSRFTKNNTMVATFMIIELIMFILLSLGVVLFLNKHLFNPLKLLLSNTHKMEKEEKVDIKDTDIISNNEIGYLLSSFLKMSNTVSDRMKELKNYQDELEFKIKERTEEVELYYLAVEQCKSSIYITDKNGAIEYVNPHFRKITGYTSDEIIGKNPRIFKSGKQSHAFYKNLWKTILSGNAWHGEMLNKYKGGKEVYAMTSISPIMDEEGNIKHFVAVREDITELKSLQSTLTYQAHYDTLTNIPNRTLFFKLLEKTLAISKRKKHAFALLFIDLDGFKNINDKYGHSIGDQLLIEVSKKIQSCIRESDTVARIGGDEFVVLLSAIASNDEPGITAKRIIDILTKHLQINGHTCHIGASIGISLYPDHSSNLDELLALADKAMYEVKHLGKNNCRYAK